MLDLLGESFRLSNGFLFAVGTELYQQPAFSIGQQLHLFGMQAFTAHVLNQLTIHPFQSNWLVLHHLRHVISCLKDALVPEHDQCPFGARRHQMRDGFQDDRAGPFAAHQGLSNIALVLWQQGF